MKKRPDNKLQKIIANSRDFVTKILKFFSTGLKRRIGLGLVVLLLIMVVVSIFTFKPVFPNLSQEKDQKTNDIAVMPEIKVSRIEKRGITDEVNTYGTVSYYQKVNVVSKVEEIADKVNVNIGDYVNKDQVLAVMKNEYIKLGVELAKEDVRGKEASFELSLAKYSNALLGVEKNIGSLDRLRIEEKQKKLEIANAARILSNKDELLSVEGVTKEQYKDAESKYDIAMLELDSILKEIQVSEIGYRDSDIKNAGENVPADKDQRLEILKKINTKVESAEVDIAKSEIERSRLQLQTSELNFDETIIKSPNNGIIAMRYIEPGEKAEKDKPIFTVIDLESLYIELPVPETELPTIKQDQVVNIKIDAYPQMTFNGIVETIYPIVDVKTRTATIRCRIKNQRLTRNRYLLTPGMFVRANIVTSSRKDALTIPFDGMAEKDNARIKVFIIKRNSTDTNTGVAVEKWVPYSKIADTYIEILQDLDEGDLIAVSGLDFLETGLRVKIKE